MPFGALFGSLVFGILATWIGWRLAHAPSAAVGLSGVFLAVLGLSLALGLLLRRPWARWTGLIGAASLALVSGAMIVQGRGESLGLFGMLAAMLTFVLLAVPSTGRFSESAAPGQKRIWAGRLLAGVAMTALAGLAVASVVPAGGEFPAEPGSAAGSPAPAVATTPGPVPATRSEKLEWHDFTPGLAKAKAAGKPVLVDFFAEWCGPCKLMERETFRDARVIARLGEVVPIRVNAEDETVQAGISGYEVAEKYRVESYPTIALMDPNGRVLARFSGYRGPREFLQWLDAAIGKAPRPA